MIKPQVRLIHHHIKPTKVTQQIIIEVLLIIVGRCHDSVYRQYTKEQVH